MQDQLENLLAETEAENARANEQIAKWTEARLRTEGALMVLSALRQSLSIETDEKKERPDNPIEPDRSPL
jgi:hypothetical protein